MNSKSDGNYFGKFKPTIDDYNKWFEWYKLNKTNLCWNEEKQEIYIKK
jgi:hypothetical protein